MNSSRLPGKFHQDIAGKPMIIHVLERARDSYMENIYVAVDDDFHFKLVEEHGYKAIMTSRDHQTGTDRVYEAVNFIDPQRKFKYVINLQGDLPFIEPESITRALALLYEEDVDIGTLAVRISDEEEINDPNVVKIAMNSKDKALYFSRARIPHNSDVYYHHLGLYAFKRQALDKFVHLKQTKLELCEKLEQLRALENDMTIMVKEVNEFPISVDAPADLEKARKYAQTRTNPVI